MMGKVEFGLALADPSAFVALHLRLRPIERRLRCERIGLHPARSMRDAGHLLASSSSRLSSKASSSDGVINWAQLKNRLRDFNGISRGLPRSKVPRLPTSANDLCGRVVQSLLKWIRETCLVASALSLASFVFFSKAERAWIVTNLIRWSIASCAFRLIMLQSWIASLVPSSARNENDDWFLKGSYQIICDGDSNDIHVGDLEGKHNSNNNITHTIAARIRQVPGSGSCLFHAVAAGVLFDHVHDNEGNDDRAHPTMSQVVEYSSKLRSQAVDTLASEGQMILQGDETITTSSLVEKASTQYGLSPAAYLSHMRQENVWGGGPEIIALAHYLKRPIVSLEPFKEDNNEEKSGVASGEGPIYFLKTTARFGPPDGCPIYILSTNDGFPGEYKGRKHNHFLAVFPAQPF